MSEQAKNTALDNSTPENISRRDFAKQALTAGVLAAVPLLTVPQAAQAWMDGSFHKRDDLAAAFDVLVRTYSDTKPYPHKFNDALVKSQLRDIDFFTQQGLDKQFAQHYVDTLGVLVNRYIRKGVEKFGKDIYLWGIFERTSCSYQLYEHIDIKAGSRSFPCPYKPILDHIDKGMGTYKITWSDVCNKWCNRIWSGFAGYAGTKMKSKPGEICTVYVI